MRHNRWCGGENFLPFSTFYNLRQTTFNNKLLQQLINLILLICIIYTSIFKNSLRHIKTIFPISAYLLERKGCVTLCGRSICLSVIMAHLKSPDLAIGERPAGCFSILCLCFILVKKDP